MGKMGAVTGSGWSRFAEVDVPRSWLGRSARHRVWYSLRDIPTERIKRVLCFSELAGATAP